MLKPKNNNKEAMEFIALVRRTVTAWERFSTSVESAHKYMETLAKELKKLDSGKSK